jgi:alpha-galactosidase
MQKSNVHHGALALAATLLLGSTVMPRASAQDAAALRQDTPPPNAIWLDSLDVSQMTQDYGAPHAIRSVDNHPLTLGGAVYPHGIGTHASSQFSVDLKGVAIRFMSLVGVDEERSGNGSLTFQVWVDGKKKAETGVLHGGDPPQLLTVDLTGARRLNLVVGDGGDGITNDHADWAGALLTLAPGAAARPVAVAPPSEPPPPIASGVSLRPAIHGPRIVGATPGRPFLFLIPATGEGPLTFSARPLPAGLTLDGKTGILSGALQKPGTTVVQLEVRGRRGQRGTSARGRRSLTIVGGAHKLALTPPMGWNSWNVWAGAVDAAKVRAAADWMVKSGLAAHGYQYINIDDTWEAGRNAAGEIQTNQKFGDMRALSDYVHGKGLKLGIYSSPGPRTCGGYEGSYGHELQDAETYARWGIDYLKYDWCSYGGIARGDNSLAALQKPYRVMHAALDSMPRDILFSLCQYGMGRVWEWGDEVGGNCWRTTGDINDSWGSLQSIGFSQDGHERYAGPGHWNDPDMLVVGRLGWGPSIHPTHLKPNEQLTHITLWCLLSAPLLTGCDLAQLDPWTTSLLTNDEVLDVNQDPLGRPAGRRSQQGMLEVWARPLWDGTTAVGLFNRGPERAKVTASWSDLQLHGRQPVRDLWQHKELGARDGAFAAEVPAHGAVLVKIGRPKRMT